LYIKKNKKGILGTRKKTNKAPMKTNTLGISPKVKEERGAGSQQSSDPSM
jgi:hypothetical protein